VLIHNQTSMYIFIMFGVQILKASNLLMVRLFWKKRHGGLSNTVAGVYVHHTRQYHNICDIDVLCLAVAKCFVDDVHIIFDPTLS